MDQMEKAHRMSHCGCKPGESKMECCKKHLQKFFFKKDGNINPPAFVIGGFVFGVVALGATAIVKNLMGDKSFRHLKADKVEIGHLKVRYLEVEDQI